MGFYSDIHTRKRFRLGTEKQDVVGNTYVYLQGVANVVAGSWVSFDEAGVTTNLATDAKPGPVAIAIGACDATTKFGWFGRDGYFICGAISGGDAAADAPVYATATDFLVDDVELDDMSVIGARFVTQEGEAATALGLTATAAKATVLINRPWFGLATDASA